MQEQQIASIGNNIVVIFFIISAFSIVWLIWYGWKLYKDRKSNKEVMSQGKNLVKNLEEDKTTESMSRLLNLLSSIEPNVEKAEAKILDAQIQTEILVNQILRVTQKIEELEIKIEIISDIVSSIRENNRENLVYSAARLNDNILQKFLLSTYILSRQELKNEAYVLLLYEKGTMEQIGESYSRMVSALVSQLSLARGKIAGLQQQIQMLESSHPLLQIESSLKDSVEVLNLRAQPALRWTAKREVPANIQGYLN